MLHSCLPYLANGHPELATNPLFRVGLCGGLGVMLFFVISGYCIFGAAYGCISNQKSIGSYLFARIRRIYPPYWIACAFALVVDLFTSYLQSRHLLPAYRFDQYHVAPVRNLEYWLTNASLTQQPFAISPILTVAWSLCYEVTFYAIIGFFLFVSASLKAKVRYYILVFGCIALTVFSLLWLIVSPQTCLFPLDRWYQFSLGALLFAVVSSEADRLKIWIRAGAVLSIVLAFIFALKESAVYVPLGVSLRGQALTAPIFALILLLLKPYSERLAQKKWMTPMLGLGAISYSVYLTHIHVIRYPAGALRKIGLEGTWYVIPFLVQILTAMAFGWVFFRIVENKFISDRQTKRLKQELPGSENAHSMIPLG